MKNIFQAQRILIVLAVYSFIFLSLVSSHIFSAGNPEEIAIIKMALGLSFIWIVLWGISQYLLKDKIKGMVSIWKQDWERKFMTMCVVLVLIEEAIATTMTNMATTFWGTPGVAFITASSNYLEVILFHSVIVFIPMFYAWKIILKKYDFRAPTVLLLFGLSWVIAEIFINPQAAVAWFWIFIYGCMIALPVYCLPERGAKKPNLFAYLQALILPTLFAMPMALVALGLQSVFLK